MAESLSASQRWLVALFLVSLPLLNPWIRGDGVGYYAFARAPLIEHSLDFTHDYQHANRGFREARLDPAGQPLPFFRLPSGHLDNHFTVGPAILWSPFLVIAHAGVLLARAFGSQVPADGFSAPYRLAMAFGTVFYGWLAILLAFRIACRFVSARWALLAAIAVWWGSSLPIYMYFNPSWSHAQSAFVVALFIWYWLRTRPTRTLRQWLILGLSGALMLNVYYANAMLLVILLLEALPQYRAALFPSASHANSDRDANASQLTATQLLSSHFVFFLFVLLGMTPTFVTRQIMYGSPFATGYIPIGDWSWLSPAFWQVLFSANHGLFSWTPLMLLCYCGLFLFAFRNRSVGVPILGAAVTFYVFISCYPDWAGISSYGNRFFVSLTPVFVLGLAVLLDHFAALFASQRAALASFASALALFVLWNIGLMYQWGIHLIPARGPIDFSLMVRNQFTTVPSDLSTHLRAYLFRRKALMEQIEQRDLQQLKELQPED